jgi:hypothetical protein
MHANDPSVLDSAALAKRLHELAGRERDVQVDFLLHLDAFDRKSGYLEAGFGSLWDFCLRALHLREGAAGRRIAAMRVLRRLPKLEAALRDGRLCLSTVAQLAPVLTKENLDDVVARAAYKTKADVDHLVASLQPRIAPKEGVRKLPEPREASQEPLLLAPSTQDGNEPARPAGDGGTANAVSTSPAPVPAAAPPPERSSSSESPRVAIHEPRPSADLRAVSGREWSLRVTIDSAFKADLQTLASLLSHKAGANLAAVLHEAIRCGIEKHGKRKGVVEPARARAGGQRDSSPTAGARSIPIAIRREVWKRDSGCCTWKGPDGRRCGSRWKVELDHVVPVALGGSSEVGNLRLLCARHNAFYAEQVYGREYMERFRRAVGTAIRSDGVGGNATPGLFVREPCTLEWGQASA